MKKVLLLLGLVLSMSLSGFAVEKSYTLTFTSNNSDNTAAATTSTTASSIFVEESQQYVTGNVSSTQRAYPKSKLGIKFGSNSGIGNITFKLSELGQVEATRYEVEAAYYDSTSGVSIAFNGGTAKSISGLTNTLATYSYELSEPTKITSITLASVTKRAYVGSITIYYEDENADKTPSEISFSAETASATLGHDNEFPTLANPNNLPVIFASSDEAVATVDAAGAVTILAGGTTVISAAFAGDETYASSTVKYTLTVIDPNNLVEVVDYTKHGYTANTKIPSYTQGDVTLASAGSGTDAQYYTNGTALRVYNNTTYTVSVPEGYKIDAVSFTTGTNGFTTATTVSPGTFKNNTWTPGTVPTNEVVFSIGSTVYIQTVTVKYSPYTKELLKYDPKFENLTLEVGKTAALSLGAEYPGEINFISDNEEVATVSDEAFVVTAVAEGTATIAVKWDGDEDWQAGSAEFTVTVVKPAAPAAPVVTFTDAEGNAVTAENEGIYEVYEGTEITITSEGATYIYMMVGADDEITSPEGSNTMIYAVSEDCELTICGYNGITAGEDITVCFLVKEAPYQRPLIAATATFDFTTEGAYGMTTYSGNDTDYEKTVSSVTVDNFTASFSGSYRLWKTSVSTELRIQKSGTLTISAPEGIYIEKITFEGGTLSSAKFNLSLSSGYAGSFSNKVWTAGNNAEISEVKFTSSDRSDITKIIVEYKMPKPVPVPVIEKGEDGATLVVTVFDEDEPEAHHIHWYTNLHRAAAAARVAALADEPEWNKHEEETLSITIPDDLAEGDRFEVFAKAVHQASGMESAVAYSVIDNAGNLSGIADVAADVWGRVRYFNLNGVEVNGQLPAGIYIRLEGNKASKHVVR